MLSPKKDHCSTQPAGVDVSYCRFHFIIDELNGSNSDEELQVFDNNEEAEIVAETVPNSINNSDEIGVSEAKQLGNEDEVMINREIFIDIISCVNEVSQGGVDVLIFSETLVSRLDRCHKGKRKTKDKMVRNAKRITGFCRFDAKFGGKMANLRHKEESLLGEKLIKVLQVIFRRKVPKML